MVSKNAVSWRNASKNDIQGALTYPFVVSKHRRRRWGEGRGGGGGNAPPVGVKCRNFGQNIGQFHIFWAILRQNFGQFHVVWASLRCKIFRALDRKTVSIWVKTFFFFWEISTIWTEMPSQFEWRPFFLEITSIWTEKTIDLSGNFRVIFRAKLWYPSKSFWAPTPMCPSITLLSPIVSELSL